MFIDTVAYWNVHDTIAYIVTWIGLDDCQIHGIASCLLSFSISRNFHFSLCQCDDKRTNTFFKDIHTRSRDPMQFHCNFVKLVAGNEIKENECYNQFIENETLDKSFIVCWDASRSKYWNVLENENELPRMQHQIRAQWFWIIAS